MKKHLLSSCFVLSIFLVLPVHSYSQRVLLPACNATQPLNQLPWLKAMVDDTIGINGYNITIYEARYKDQIIYRVENIIAPDFGTVTLYNCLGFVLCKTQVTIAGLQSTCSDLFREVTCGALLYRRINGSVASAK